jgi:hypothetical protein
VVADRSVLVRLRADISNFQRNFRAAGAESAVLARRLEDSDRRGGAAIDRLSGRIGLLTDAMLTIGPAAIPIGAVAVPALTTLASSLGFVALGAGSAAIAFGGVGDALETLNKARLDPTEKNLAEAEKALKRLSPAAQDFIKQLDSMRALGKELRDAGAEELFPGLTEALDTLEERAPEVQRIVEALNGTLGDIAAEGAASLASERWDDFFQMLETEGPRTLDATADAIGNVVHGLSEIMEAFIPLNRDGLDWLVEMTEGFDDWATGLKNTKGFHEFVDYIRENGPQVAETLGAVATAGLDILEASAPLGGPGLRAIEAFAEMVSKIADSDFATPLLAGVAAMRAINRLAPATAGSLALLGGGGAAGGAAAAGGKDGKGGKPRPRRGRGITAGAALGTYLAADFITAELGWEEATDRQLKRGEAFAEKWGKTWSEAAEDARVKLSDVLDVAYGRGPFGLKANDRGLTDKLLTQPIEKQIRLEKQLREEYGLGFKALENRGILVEGFTEQFRRQRDAVSPLANDIKRLGEMKAHPEIDLDDKAARAKQRDADDWIMAWGRKNGAAKADIDDFLRRRKAREADDWIMRWGNENAAAQAEVDAQQAFVQFRLLGLRMDDLDGRVVTTYVQTLRRAGDSPGFGPQPTGAAAGGTVYSPRRYQLFAS